MCSLYARTLPVLTVSSSHGKLRVVSEWKVLKTCDEHNEAGDAISIQDSAHET